MNIQCLLIGWGEFLQRGLMQLGSPCSVVVAARLCIHHAALKKDIMAVCQYFMVGDYIQQVSLLF